MSLSWMRWQSQADIADDQPISLTIFILLINSRIGHANQQSPHDRINLKYTVIFLAQQDEFSKCVFHWGPAFFRASFPYTDLQTDDERKNTDFRRRRHSIYPVGQHYFLIPCIDTSSGILRYLTLRLHRYWDCLNQAPTRRLCFPLEAASWVAQRRRTFLVVDFHSEWTP